MKRYDNYKDSGIEWIGEIPEHWEIQRLKYAFDLGTGLSITKENLVEKGVPCVNYGEIHSKYGFEVDINKHNLKCVDLNYLNTSKKALMKQGEFIFADTSEDIEGSGNFTHIKSNGDIFAGYHTITARPIKKSNSLYFAFLFDSIDYRTQIRNSVKGIKVFSITQGILKDTFIWHPPIEEQTAISNYLDRKTAQIDTLIAKKEQFISLLHEERIAVINQAVTKGLDPKAKMKDSGIEWLGEIPEHWEVGKFNLLVNIRHGHQFMNYDFTENGIRIIKITQLHKNGYLDISNCSYISPNRLNEFSSILIKENDILMCLTGGTIGKIIRVGQVSEPLLQNYRVGHFSSNDSKTIIDDYIFWVMSSDCLISQIFFQMRETGQPNIGMGDFSRMKISFPNVTEQIEIVNHIKNKTIEIDRLILKSLEEIELLKEYKTALISEVVTGKVDVR